MSPRIHHRQFVRPALITTIAASFAGMLMPVVQPVSADMAIDPTLPPKTQLEMYCRLRGGDTIFTPYAIVRCQAARDHRGFEYERALCETGLDGEFHVGATTNRMNRSNWACVSTTPAPN